MSCNTCTGLGTINCGVKLQVELMAGLYWLASVLNSSTKNFCFDYAFLLRAQSL